MKKERSDPFQWGKCNCRSFAALWSSPPAFWRGPRRRRPCSPAGAVEASSFSLPPTSGLQVGTRHVRQKGRPPPFLFNECTGWATLDRLLRRIQQHRGDLLRALARARGGVRSFSLPSLGQEPSASSQAGIERSRRRSVHPEFLCRALTGLGERQDWQGFAAVNWRLRHRSFGLSWRRSRNPIFIASKPPFVASTEESSVMVAIGRARQGLSSWRTFLPLHWRVGLVKLVRYIGQV